MIEGTHSTGKPCPLVNPGDRIKFHGGPIDGHEIDAELIGCQQMLVITDLESKPFYLCTDRDDGNLLIFKHVGSVAHYFKEGAA